MTTGTAAIDEQDWWETAQKLFPGGVNASARLNTVIGRSFLVSQGVGGTIIDYQGHQYIDLCMSAGASLLGYEHPAIHKAVEQAAKEGFLCGHETVHQISVAYRLTELISSAEMVRFCGSGTEATLYAIRLARTYTKKSIIVKFEGHFHGYQDYLSYSVWPPIEQAGAWTSPRAYPETEGIPATLDQHVIVIPFNNLDALSELLKKRHNEIAAVIMEPVNYNSGSILPIENYLKEVKQLTKQYEVLLIFDEVMSGFRVCLGGIQDYFNVTPDLTTFGKAMGGGMPLAALVGRREIMEKIAPQGKMMHSGTFTAHPVSILAAKAFLNEVSKPNFYPQLLSFCEKLYKNLRIIFKEAGVTIKVQALGARFSLLFGIPEERQVLNYRDVASQDHRLANRFYALALEEGIYFRPSWHHGLCAAHTEEQINSVLNSVERITHRLKK